MIYCIFDFFKKQMLLKECADTLTRYPQNRIVQNVLGLPCYTKMWYSFARRRVIKSDLLAI